MTSDHIRPDWPAPANVNAAVTVRAAGGASIDGYEDFNLADHVGDDPERVRTNRERLINQLQLPGEPYWLEQVHGSNAVNLEAVSGPVKADAAFTCRVGQVATVMTADCLPVLLADRSGGCVAAVHGGWRGLAAGVISETVAAMGVSPDQLIAWLGPGISQGAYEVDATVRDAFVALDAEHAGCFLENRRQRWQANLYALARRLLTASGVKAIYGGGFCTFYDERRFYSYRRQGTCGRMASLIWLS